MATPSYYMACIDLTGRAVLVVGAGRVALEKIEGLLSAGAEITVVAPQILPEVEELPVTFVRRGYRSADLDGKFLVVAATATTSVNRRVFRDAESRALLCNVVDVPELCSFILPAVHRHEPIAVAVSTGGASPALAKRLRDELGARIEERHVTLAHRLRDLRPWARTHYRTYRERKEFFEAAVDEALS